MDDDTNRRNFEYHGFEIQVIGFIEQEDEKSFSITNNELNGRRNGRENQIKVTFLNFRFHKERLEEFDNQSISLYPPAAATGKSKRKPALREGEGCE